MREAMQAFAQRWQPANANDERQVWLDVSRHELDRCNAVEPGMLSQNHQARNVSSAGRRPLDRPVPWAPAGASGLDLFRGPDLQEVAAEIGHRRDRLRDRRVELLSRQLLARGIGLRLR